MYYLEQWVNGEMCWKSTPNGEWIPFTLSQYKDLIKKLELALEKERLKKYSISGT